MNKIRWVLVAAFPALCGAVGIGFLIVFFKHGDWLAGLAALLLFSCIGFIGGTLTRYRWCAHLWGEEPIRWD